MGLIMNKLLIFLFSLLAVSLEAATITNWGAQLPTAAPASGDVILMQKGGVTYYFTPNQLATNLSTNAAVSAMLLPISGLQYNSNGVQRGSQWNTITNGILNVRSNIVFGTNFPSDVFTNVTGAWDPFGPGISWQDTNGARYLLSFSRGLQLWHSDTNWANGEWGQAFNFSGTYGSHGQYIRDYVILTGTRQIHTAAISDRVGDVSAHLYIFPDFINGYVTDFECDYFTQSLGTHRTVHKLFGGINEAEYLVGPLHPTNLTGVTRGIQWYGSYSNLTGANYECLVINPISDSTNLLAGDFLARVALTNENRFFIRKTGSAYFNGPMGIGTTNPIQILTLSNTTAASSSFGIYASNNPTPNFFVSSNGSVTVGTATPAGFTFQAGGNAGPYTISIGNSVYVTAFGSTFGAQNVSWSGGLTYSFDKPLGIGTTLPASSLDATGQVRSVSTIITNSVSIMAQALAAPASTAFTTSTGAHLWNDGTNLCVVMQNASGTRTTNKISMTAWP